MARASLTFRASCSSGLGLLALGAFALAAGIYDHGAATAALGVVLIVGPLGVRFTLRLGARGVVLRQIGPDCAFEGDTVEVRIRIENRSRIPIFFPRFSEIFRPEDDAQKDVLFADRIPSGECVERCYHGVCRGPRGVYAFGPSVLRLSDPFGWFEVRRQLSADWLLKVYPAIEEIAVPERLGEVLAHVECELTRARSGESSEFFAVRDFVAGDPTRRIHWGLTAHRGHPIVREFAANAIGDFVCVVDVCHLAGAGSGPDSNFESSVRTMASVAALVLRRSRRVGLVCGKERAASVPVAAGAAQLTRILDVLVEVHADTPESLDAVLARITPTLTPGTVAVLAVHPYLFDRSELAIAIAGLRRQGVEPLAVIFDVRTRSGRDHGRAAERCHRRLASAGVAALIHRRSAVRRRGRGDAA